LTPLRGRRRAVFASRKLFFKAVAGPGFHASYPGNDNWPLLGESGSEEIDARAAWSPLIRRPTAGSLNRWTANRWLREHWGVVWRQIGADSCFQDPYGSLNPRQRIGANLEETASDQNAPK